VPEEVGYALHPQLEGGKDSFLGFINWMNEVVKSKGRTLRIWHDGLGGGGAVTVAPEVIVEWWSNHAGPPPQELIAGGHQVLNAGWFPTYYVNGPLGSARPDMRSAYESWEVNQFYGPLVANETLATPPHTLAEDEPANRGSLLHVWNDDPEAATEEEIEEGIAPRLRVLAQKTWRSPPPTASYEEFQRLEQAVGSAP
jgi:hexosaminidase